MAEKHSTPTTLPQNPHIIDDQDLTEARIHIEHVRAISDVLQIADDTGNIDRLRKWTVFQLMDLADSELTIAIEHLGKSTPELPVSGGLELGRARLPEAGFRPKKAEGRS